VQFNACTLIEHEGTLSKVVWPDGRTLLPDVELPEVIKQPIEIRKPQNQNDNHHTIQDRFDLSLHWDEPVHKPQQKPDGNNCDDNGGKWHFMFSNLNIGHDPRARHGLVVV
jgi:hypothetical protein